MGRLRKLSWIFNWYGFAIFLSLILVLPITTISYEAFAGGQTPSNTTKQIVITHDQYQKINSKYNQTMEKGFCMYGTINSKQIVIKEIDYVNNPLSEAPDHVNFLCIDETIKRLPELYLNPNYKLLGNIHTHPDSSYPSYADVYSMGFLALVQRTYGIYNGEDLNFFGRKGLLKKTYKVNNTD